MPTLSIPCELGFPARPLTRLVASTLLTGVEQSQAVYMQHLQGIISRQTMIIMFSRALWGIAASRQALTVRCLGLDSLAIWCNEDAGHEAQGAVALSDNVAAVCKPGG